MTKNTLEYNFHTWRRDLTNFSFLKHSKFSGMIVSMHQSGTHWLKHMLAVAISCEYKLPMPQYNHANDIIGGYKSPRKYKNAPYLASSHSIINPIANVTLIRKITGIPKYVVLIRDIRATLISNFKKWEKDYKCEFSEYIRGDKSGKRFNHDIWWCIRFNNCWGRLHENNPEEILVVKYENLTKDPVSQLDKINSFLELKLTKDSIQNGVIESSKEKMILKDDPERPAGSVRLDHSMDNLEFDREDKAFVLDVIKKYMKYDFNYNYEL